MTRALRVGPPPRAGRSVLVLAAKRADPHPPPEPPPPPKPLPTAPPERGWFRLPKEDGLVVEDGSGGSLAVFAKHDSVEFMRARGGSVTAIHFDATVAFRVGLFLVRWWAWNCWFGLRERLWRKLDARRKAAALGVDRR